MFWKRMTPAAGASTRPALLFSDDADDKSRTGDVNADLWAGLVLVVVAIAFAVWVRLRPVVVDERAVEEAREDLDDANR